MFARWVWVLLALLLLLVLIVGGVAGGLWWTVRSEAGTAWLLSRVPGLAVAAPRGALLADFEAERIEFTLPANGGSVKLANFGWRGLQLRVARPATDAEPWVHLAIADLHAARVDVLLNPGEKTAEPLKPPASLRLPLEVEVAALRVGELHAAALGAQPLRGLQAKLHLGADGGARHRVDDLALAWDKLRASGAVSIGASPPFDLNVQAAASQEAVDAASWRADATLTGPLEAPTLVATLRARATPQQAEQALDARAVLRPFAAWPLGDLQASTKALDLSAMASAAPATALSGSASVQTNGLDQPAAVKVQLDNARAGRWNEGLLPLRRLAIELGGRPGDRQRLDVTAFDAELGNQRQAGGRVQGSGRWTPERATLELTLSALQPAQLDARAPAMQLGGTIALAGTGLDPAAPEKAVVDLKADISGPLSALTQLAASTPAKAVRPKTTAKSATPAKPINSAKPARPAAATGNARLQIDASASLRQVDIRSALASLGAARASVSGRANRASDSAPWKVDAKLALTEFDPLPWWPGRDDSPWRRGPHRLNASGSVDLQLLDFAKPQPLADQLAALTGKAQLKLADSVLAGTPVSADLTLAHAAGSPAQLALVAELSGNRIDAKGRFDPNAGAGRTDQFDLTVAAPELARLTPLWRLVAGKDAALAGALKGDATVRGRWPELSSNGQLEGRALRVDTVAVQALQTHWQLGTAANAPVDLTLALSGVAMPAANGEAGPSLETVQLKLAGNAAAHTLTLNAESKALPPAWADLVQAPAAGPAAAAPPRSVAVLQAQGGLTAAGGNSSNTGRAWTASGWRGTIGQIELRSNQVGAAPWVSTRNLALQAQWADGPARVVVQPGRAELLGALLRFERISWQAAVPGGGAAQIEAKAELEPLPVAPLLARLQPAFGWGGDLALGGRLAINSAPTFSADIVIERARGDLTVTDEAGNTQPLGLSDLRLGLNAKDGVWSFTQGLAGRALGVAAGAVVARTTPTATWPAADTPIEGVLELQVANLGTWGNWVPAGWRLGGALRTSASIAGRFGAPEYTGQVRGTGLSVRNFVQGVNVSDGDVAITLAGATARIERFTARAGTGSVTLSGEASLGEAPRAALALKAERFQLLGRVDRRIVASGNAQLSLDKTTIALDGKFGVDEGLFDFSRSDAPSLAADVVVLRGQKRMAPADAPAPAPAAPVAATARKLALNLGVDLGQKLRIRGRGIDSGLRGELKITSPYDRLAINGTISTVEGTYAAYGQKLKIDRGAISFAGSADNPRLDIQATRPDIDTTVGVRVTGTALNPRIRLFSEPELSDLDKLSWLVLGRASDSLGRTDTALLQRAAVALLAGEGDGVTGQLTRAIGLDDVSLRQTDGEVKETVVSLGKQLSQRWYVGYERGLNATAGTWQLIYRVAQRFTLRAQSGLDNSLDVIWTWRWQ